MNHKSTDPTSWWYYFEKIEGGKKAKCNHCEWETLRGKAAGTNGLKFHLQGKHPEQFSQKLEAERLAEKKKMEDNKKRASTSMNLTDLFHVVEHLANDLAPCPKIHKCTVWICGVGKNVLPRKTHHN